jgi:predicted transcriptional regulator
MDSSTGHLSPTDLVKAVSEVMVAFLAQRPIEPEELPALLIEVRRALTCDIDQGAAARSQAAVDLSPVVKLARAASEEPGAHAPEPPIPEAPMPDTSRVQQQTVFDEYLICLEDGKPYRSLRRHLMSRYGMTPDAYRTKWNLPKDYPMVAPSYARARSEVAKRIGLGRPAQVSTVKDRSPRRRA